jgi:hypothetical protein
VPETLMDNVLAPKGFLRIHCWICREVPVVVLCRTCAIGLCEKSYQSLKHLPGCVTCVRPWERTYAFEEVVSA